MTKLDRFSFYIFLATIFLLPFFFIPLTDFSLGVSKGLLFSIGIILSFILWLVSRFWSGSLILPKSRIFFASLLLLAVFFLAALFSPVRSVSLLGNGYEIGTFGNIALSVLALFLAANFFRTKKENFYLFLTLCSSFVLLFLTVVAGLIGGPSSGLSEFLPVNLMGSWNDLAIFSGIIIIYSLIFIEFFQENKSLRIFSGIILVAALFLLSLINFYVVWIVVGLAALFVLIASFTWRKSNEIFKFPAASFFLVVFCFIFLVTNGLIGNYLSDRLNVDNTEVRPSITATYNVARQVLNEQPILGVGPNRFVNSWQLFKPEIVNQTPLWDANFNYGVGMVPTFIVTTGLFGLLAWILFFVVFLLAGYKSLKNVNHMDYGSPAIFLIALILWIFISIYTANLVIFSLAFILTGAFIGTLSTERKMRYYELSFLKDPRLSFFSIIILVGLVIGTLALGYGLGKKFISIVYFQKSAIMPNTSEGIVRAESYLMKSVFWDSNNDLYYRSLTQLYLFELGSLLNQNRSIPEESKTKAQVLLNRAEFSARLAVAKDSSNYLNWLSLTSIYEQLMPLGVTGAYDNAKQSLFNAVALNPKNPGLYARLAKIEIAGQNFSSAEEYIKKAIELRPNDQDLINFLDQLNARAR